MVERREAIFGKLGSIETGSIGLAIYVDSRTLSVDGTEAEKRRSDDRDFFC